MRTHSPKNKITLARDHAPPAAPEVKRLSPDLRGYGTAWKKLRLMVLARSPLCVKCQAPAKDVDHVLPKAKGGADLCGANLKHAYLGVANLSDANLHGANLEGADLVGANLIYVNLTGACFSGAKLDYEDMEYVKNGGAIVEESIEELNKEAILFVSACKLKSTKKKEIDLAENEYNDAKSNLDLESSKHLAVQEDFDRVIINSNTVSCNFERELKIAIGLVKSSDCSNSSLENLDAIIVVNDAEIILFKEIIAEKKTLLSESEYRLNLAKEEERKEKDKLDEARSEYEANEVKIALYLSKV